MVYSVRVTDQRNIAPIRATQPMSPKPVAVKREVAPEVLVVAARDALAEATDAVLTARD